MLKNLLLFIALSFCWGPSFLFIKLGVETIPPMTMVTLRVGIGCLLLGIFCFFKKISLLPYLKFWKHFLVVGLTSMALPFILIGYAEKTIPSALAAIINGSVPIFVVLFAHYFIPKETLNFKTAMGIFLGFIGIITIFYPTIRGFHPENKLGSFLVLIASISYAVGIGYSRLFISNLPRLVSPFYQAFFAFFMVIPFSLIWDRPFSIPFPSVTSIVGVIGLAIIGTALAFILYFEMIRVAGAVYLSFVSLSFPLVGLLLGVIFLDEFLKWNAYLGTALILSALIIINLIKLKIFGGGNKL